MRIWLRHYWSLVVPVAALLVVTYGAFRYFNIDSATFLAIFIPAMVGLIGSWGLYLKRRVDNIRRLRKALRSELEGMTWFTLWPDKKRVVPAYDPVPATLYDQNADDLGSLTDAEVTHLVEFYSRAEVTGRILGHHGTRLIEADTSVLGLDLNKDEREAAIAALLDRLALNYQRALFTLQKRLDGATGRAASLTAGQIVDDDHRVVDERLVLCLDYGLLEQVGDGEYRVTEKGDAFFEGELSGAELDKQYDVLRRDEGLTDKIRRGLGWVLNDGGPGRRTKPDS